MELTPHYDRLLPAHHQPLVEKQAIIELLRAAEEIKVETATNYTERRALAVDYDKQVRRYQYRQFSLTTNIED